MALRLLLADYLDKPAAALEFGYSRLGKPELAQSGEPRLRFNLSHCDDLAVIAVTLEDRVGIDVERLRHVEDADGLADMCFSARELRDFRSVAEDRRIEAFFSCWTRKESFVKAVGDGLSYPLKEFDVTVRPGETPRLLALQGSTERSRSWSIVALQPMTGWTAAVAVESGDAEVEVLGWR